MFTSRSSNNLINKVHERSLRIITNNFDAPYEELLDITKNVSMHTKNLQRLMTEIFKYINGLSPPIMNDIFSVRSNHYNLRNFRELNTNRKSTVLYGTESISFRAPQLWQILPRDIKDSASLNMFKSKVKSWKGDGCPCRLCKRYIPSLGFL